MEKSYFVFGLIAIIVIATGAVLWSANKPTQIAGPDSSRKLKIVTSFYTIGEFAHQVGGDLVDVEVITPAGTEPHDYEPTPQQIADIYASDVFLFNGAGLDSWAEKIAADLNTKQVYPGVSVGEMRFAVDINGATDPHFWLDPKLAIKEVQEISLELARIDETNRQKYTDNANSYIAKLTALSDEYKMGLAKCSQRTIVTSHNAFTYLADEYNFDVIALTGLSPDAEPSAGRLAEIAKLAEEKKMKYIYFETLVSPKLAQTIADEIGATTLIFNPLEGLTNEELAAGENYISVMETNLQNLRIGMICE